MGSYRRLLPLLAFTAAAFIPPAVFAQAQKDASLEVQVFGRQIQRSQSLEAYLKSIASAFAKVRIKGDTLTREDVDFHERVAAAQARVLMAMQLLPTDLDGDGFVTRGEISQMYDYQQRSRQQRRGDGADTARDRYVDSMMARDADKDGRISLAEAFSTPGADTLEGKRMAGRRAGDAERARLALQFDADANGEVTSAEFETAGEALFRAVDRDNDGQISEEEARSLRDDPPEITDEIRRAAAEAARRRAAAAAEAKAAEQAKVDAVCAMPKASPDAEVILAGVYEGQTIPTVTIGSQDQTMSTAILNVEPGSTPLYVVVASLDPMIWRVSGAVERIERLVLGTQTGLKGGDPKAATPLVGATGLPADRVSFLSPARCAPYFTEAPSTGSAKAAAIVREKSGKSPTTIVAQYGVDQVSVPSGAMTSLRDKPPGNWPLIVTPSGALRITGEGDSMTVTRESTSTEAELRRFTPGGVVEIDPATVVASAPVERYVVLPDQAGLVQLIQEGALKQNKSGEYLIQKKMRFPAGLAGAHSVTFLLLRGVPIPDGDPGHSTVVSEETGEVLADPFNRKWKPQ